MTLSRTFMAGLLVSLFSQVASASCPPSAAERAPVAPVPGSMGRTLLCFGFPENDLKMVEVYMTDLEGQYFTAETNCAGQRQVRYQMRNSVFDAEMSRDGKKTEVLAVSQSGINPVQGVRQVERSTSADGKVTTELVFRPYDSFHHSDVRSPLTCLE